VIATTGEGDRLAKVGISVGDIGAGVYGAMSVLSALYERTVTGKGRLVSTSLFDALAEWMGYPAYYTLYGGTPPARAGVRHATVIPYGSYLCGDGQSVLLAVQTDVQWSNFCKIVCEHPEWTTDERYTSASGRRLHREVLEADIENAFAAHSRTEITRRLEEADVPYGDVNDVAQFLDHPQLSSRDRWRKIESPVGPLQAILPQFVFEGFEPAMGAIPEIGQHTDDVLKELGYDEPTIKQFHDARVI
jgi:crotonobetainyl-CoA:carnitine CoA-transferase CaiB-like acyl-CoA transferase